MLVDQIKKANIEAMKNKDTVARSIYSVLLNKIMLEGIKKREKGEEVVDADVVQILNKSIKELEEEKNNYVKVGNDEQANNLQKQIEIVKVYLPEMLSEEKIAEIIKGLEDKTLPFVMKYFKTNYNGQCDMGVVRNVLNRGVWKFLL